MNFFRAALSAKAFGGWQRLCLLLVILTGTAQADLTNGLLAYYPLDTNTLDRSGNGLDGTPQAVTFTTSGAVNGACVFNGTDSFIDLGNPLSLNMGTNDFSISFWLKSSMYRSQSAKVIYKGSWGSTRGYSFYMRGYEYNASDNGIVGAEIASTSGGSLIERSGSESLSDNQWHHVVLVADRDGNGTIFVDNAVYAERDITSDNGSLDSSENITVSGAQNAYEGLLDEIRIYSRALGTQEVAELFELYAPPPAVYTNLVIDGPTALFSGASASFESFAQFNQGQVSNVTLQSTWQLNEPIPDGLSLSSNTLITSAGITDAVVVVQATCALLDTTNTAQRSVHIMAPSTNTEEGLLLYYPFNGTAEDTSGRGHHGEVFGATYVDYGARGGAYHFDGIDDYINAGHPDDLDMGTNDFSISIWFRSDVNRYEASPILYKGSWGSSIGYSLYMRGSQYDSANTGIVGAEIASTSYGTVIENNQLPKWNDGEWHHLVFNADRSGLGTLYVDNEFYVSRTLAADSGSLSNNYALLLGGGSTSWDGYLDEVRIYDHLLTPDLIENLFLQRETYTRELDHLEIVAPHVLSQSNHVDLICRAHFNDASTSNITDQVTWALSPDAPSGTVLLDTLLQAGTVDTSSLISVSATYIADAITNTVTHNITLLPLGEALEQGLVLYYPFDNDTLDYSGYGHHGTAYGTAFSTNGALGGACQFDGISDYISAGDSDLLDIGTNNLTISLWFKSDAYRYSGAPMIYKGSWGSSIGYSAYMRGTQYGVNNAGRVGVEVASTSGGTLVENSASPSFNDDKWHHVLFSGNRTGQGDLYVDNQLIATRNMINDQGSLNNSTPLTIGGESTFFQGWLDEIRIYNRLLSTDEMALLYLSPEERGVALTNLSIAGPTQLIGGLSATYTAELEYSDGSMADGTAETTWSITSGSSSNLHFTGATLTTPEVTQDTLISIQAEYTQGTNHLVQTQDVLLQIDPATLVYYVATNSIPQHPYTNWAQAARTIQTALDVAVDGATVLVGPGTYYESDLSFKGKNLRVGSLFVTTEDPEYVTQTIIDANGTNRVITFDQGESSDAILSGFTLRNGHAHGDGGGILCLDSSPTLDTLILSDNTADNSGGGIHLQGSYARLTYLSASNNTAMYGGGLSCVQATPALENLDLAGNQALDGGGAYVAYCSPEWRSTVIRGNQATRDGGGLYLKASGPSLNNLTLLDNMAGGNGGALRITYFSHANLNNSLVWSNQPHGISFSGAIGGQVLVVDHSTVEGGADGILHGSMDSVIWGSGNLVDDPLFTSARDGHLSPGSPAVNAGTNKSWMGNATDLDRNPRASGAAVDQGAYEQDEEAEPFASLQCILSPEAAVAIGAQWRLTTGTATNWQSSATRLFNLPAGSYVVEFSDLPAWGTPDSQLVVLPAGSNVTCTGRYTLQQIDVSPPVIDSVNPGDGYVSLSNSIAVTVVAHDNVGISSVTINKQPAQATTSNTYSATVSGIRNSFNEIQILVTDGAGNQTETTINYAQSNDIRMHAVWRGRWRIRNPYDETYYYHWEIPGTSESGEGLVAPHADTYFDSAAGSKSITLYLNGSPLGTYEASETEAPELMISDELLDSDGDGQNNLQEELAGTDPNLASSAFVLSSGSALPADAVMLKTATFYDAPLAEATPYLVGNVFSWPTGSDSIYTLEVSQDMSLWTPVPGYINAEGTGSQMSYTNRGENAVSHFRVRAGKKP